MWVIGPTSGISTVPFSLPWDWQVSPCITCQLTYSTFQSLSVWLTGRKRERERDIYGKRGSPIHFILILRYNEHELKLFGNFTGVLFIKSSVYVFNNGVLNSFIWQANQQENGGERLGYGKYRTLWHSTQNWFPIIYRMCPTYLCFLPFIRYSIHLA